MKTMFLCIFLLLAGEISGLGDKNGPREGLGEGLRVMFWNLENFFDWRADSTSVSELEFSSFGERHWTRKRFEAKCNAVAKAVLWTASQEGGLPDVIGVAEVENAFVLRRLLQLSALRKLDYRIVHFDSPDPRGIDVALLYRASRLTLTDALPCHLYQGDTLLRTRDILLARFTLPDQPEPPPSETKGNDNRVIRGKNEEGGKQAAGTREIAFLVNHHPSKYGGAAVSEGRRRIAVERLGFLADSLRAEGVERIVAMGDFNDTPANPVYGLLAPGLENLAEPLHQKGEGTIKYDGAWELIDMYFVTPECGAGEMKILHIPFLSVRDKGHGGTQPLRTYSGPRYLGGVSDHCPIWLELFNRRPR